MTVEGHPGLQVTHAPEQAGALAGERSPILLRALVGAAVALGAFAFASLVAVWPTLTLLVVTLLLVAVLAFVAPPFALAAAVLIYGLEGVIKVGLIRELEGIGVAPEAAGAAFIDVTFLLALAGLVRLDRGRTLRAIWLNGGRATRIGLTLLAGWFVISLLQIPLSGDIGKGLEGFRLTQGYLLFAVAGAMLLARARREHVVAALMGVLIIIAAYAAFRAVAGPSDAERLAAFSRSTTPLVPSGDSVIFRNIGSFSSAIALASFLVPTGALLFALGLSLARVRLAAWIGVALVVVALVATQVRTSLLAIAIGVICTVALILAASTLTRRAKIALAASSVPLLIVLVVLGAVGQSILSGGSAEVRERSFGVVNPLEDPSLESRLDRWRDSLDVVAKHPLGTGLGTVGRATVDQKGAATFADNSFLKVLQEQGPLGAIAFLGGLLATLIAAASGVIRAEPHRRAVGIAALSGCVSFFVLGLSSEVIEQPGKVLGWLLLGVALWSGGVPQRRSAVEGGGVMREAGALVASLPRWARSRWALAAVMPLVVVPVALSLQRAPDFKTTLEVFPTNPPGNAGIGLDEGSLVSGAIANSELEDDARGWQPQPGFALQRSTDKAHSGTASLASARNGRIADDGRVASTRVTLPAPGRYRLLAWVRLPRGYRGGAPTIALESPAHGSSPTGARAGDPRVRGRWQRIWAVYVVDASELEGVVSLRTESPLPERGQVLYWDDIRVLASNGPRMPAPPRVNLVPNPGFEHDTGWWGDPPAFGTRRSDAVAHSGSASLRASSDGRRPSDTNAGYTYVVFPRAGTYRARAWVYIPRSRPAGRATVTLEGFSGSRQLSQRLSDTARRATWQPVSSVYAVSARDLEGALVLRVAPETSEPEAGESRGRETLVAYWDDVRVSAPRPEPPRDARGPANRLRSALEEPQLRFEVAQMAADDRLYDPRRATVVRSGREDALSYTVRVSTEVPDDARRLGRPLRVALARAGRRSTLRRAQASWQDFISKLGRELPSGHRKLLRRRAEVVQSMIGAPARDVVALPGPARAPSAAQLEREQRIARRRQRIAAHVGEHLPPRQRALVAERVDDLQRMIASQTAEYVVMPARRVPDPPRAADRLLGTLPGPFPPRVAPGAAAAAGLGCALLLFVLIIAVAGVRARAAASGG